MISQATTKGDVYAPQATDENFGLHAGALGPLETLARSISAIAPGTQ